MITHPFIVCALVAMGLWQAFVLIKNYVLAVYQSMWEEVIRTVAFYLCMSSAVMVLGSSMRYGAVFVFAYMALLHLIVLFRHDDRSFDDALSEAKEEAVRS